VKAGDKVVMNDKYYVSEVNKNKIWTVRGEPKKICGEWAVFLEDYIGCYAMDGLTVVQHD